MRPPFAYFGGKTTLAERIARLLPAHLHYVEPFCGSLSVLLAKPPSAMETVNDLDGALMTFWRVLRDRPGELQRACALTPHSRAEYVACRDLEECDEIEAARRVWVLLTQGRSSTLRESKTGWRHFVSPRGSSIGMAGYVRSYYERLAPIAERLHCTTLESMPALDLIAKYGREPDVLLYVDPPYLGSVRGPGDNYRHEMKAEADHRDLAEALNAAAAAVVVSGYASDLYDRDLYAGWDRLTLPGFASNSSGDRTRTEVLWSNVPLGTQASLFDLEAPA